MNRMASMIAVVALGIGGLGIAGSALAQGGGGGGGVDTAQDYRVKADFRAPTNGAWASHESLGNCNFRVHSRFMQVYYGGVARQDEFKFSVEIDFRGISGFSTQFASSPYNTSYDVYIDDDFVGRATQSVPGFATLYYKSRHPELPELPVPANWPSPIDPGSAVRVFAAAATLPAIGDPFPTSTTPILVMTTLEEEFARGDANLDGHVDSDDFDIFASSFDPTHTGVRVGPFNGDFTGDNFADLADYAMLANNWDDNSPVPPAPEVCLGSPAGPNDVSGCVGSSATFTVGAVGTGPFTYAWQKNGVAIDPAANPSAQAATLTIASAGQQDAGDYACLVGNACGSVLSSSAAMTVCVADYNCADGVSVQDMFDFLNGWFAGETRTDINGENGIGVQDVFDYMSIWFAGCN